MKRGDVVVVKREATEKEAEESRVRLGPLSAFKVEVGDVGLYLGNYRVSNYTLCRIYFPLNNKANVNRNKKRKESYLLLAKGQVELVELEANSDGTTRKRRRIPVQGSD